MDPWNILGWLLVGLLAVIVIACLAVVIFFITSFSLYLRDKRREKVSISEMSEHFPPVNGERGMIWGAKREIFKRELTALEKANAASRQSMLDKVQTVYEEGSHADGNVPNFYYREYEDEGLLAVYKAGIAVGRSVTNVDFGPFIGDGDFFTINGEEYQARLIEESDDPFHGEVIRLVLVKFKEKTDD